MKIGIIGAGWYGCHLALALKKAGHDVTLFEKNEGIFSSISGTFGIRLHAGPHYPRSEETRKNCKRGFSRFIQHYPELVIAHQYSIYGLGDVDADGNPSKVDVHTFRSVCGESDHCNEIDPESYGYQGLLSAIDVEEPSIAVGSRLRNAFIRYLNDADVKINYNYEVKKIEPSRTSVLIGSDTTTEVFDKVINATSYQAFVPNDNDFPFDFEIKYQPCLALIYKDTTPDSRPISFIVTDGWFPSLLPITADNESASFSRSYILTHGKWTIMGSYSTSSEAKHVLTELDTDFVERYVKPSTENEMSRFWPTFADRFEYCGWTGEVLAKLKTKREFRSAITYEKDGIIQIVPGKINNIFDVEDEVLALLQDESLVLQRHGYRYIKNGVLDTSRNEIIEKPRLDDPNTCNLQTYQELQLKVSTEYAIQPRTSTFFKSTSSLYQRKNKQLDRLPQNYHFELQCLAGLVGGVATLTAMICILPIVGTTLSVIAGSAAIIGASCWAYNLFVAPQNQQKEALDMEQPLYRLENRGA